MNSAFELELGEDPRAADRGDRLLEAADVGLARRDQLEAPTLRLGETLVHAQQIAGEERGFVAAGAGADFEHRGALIGRIAGQQLQRERALRLRQLVADVLGLGRCHFLELGLGRRVGDHAVQDVQLGAEATNLAGGGGNRLDLRIFLRQPHEIVGRDVPRSHRVGKLLLLRLDRSDPFRRDVGHS